MQRNFWRSLQRRFIDHQAAVMDLVGLIAIGALLLCFFLRYRPSEFLLDLQHFNPGLRLGEWLLWAATMSLFVAFFAFRRWHEALAQQNKAETDALTRVDNRRRGRQLLQFEYERARRYKRPISLILFDIDHFKKINDTHGHSAGDFVLAKVARRVKRKLRSTDLIARWGGEEFLIVCPETDLHSAKQLAERLRLAIRARPIAEVGIVTTSFGVVSHAESMPLDTMLEAADQAMYRAKDMGRDCVVAHHAPPASADPNCTWMTH